MNGLKLIEGPQEISENVGKLKVLVTIQGQKIQGQVDKFLGQLFF